MQRANHSSEHYLREKDLGWKFLDPCRIYFYQDIIGYWNTFLPCMDAPENIRVPFTSVQTTFYCDSAGSFILVTTYNYYRRCLLYSDLSFVNISCISVLKPHAGHPDVNEKHCGLLSRYWVLSVPLDRHCESLILVTRTTLATLGCQFLLPIVNFTCNMFKLISFSCRNWLPPALFPISEVS